MNATFFLLQPVWIHEISEYLIIEKNAIHYSLKKQN
jgi:hypothetical protein